ncbi:hypothetical protein [Botryobacter ruber]|uniref:hypothetical protein n=1 Tax=Botryobacter ruber TaxID=2171629 RepID=UPI0013E2A257|nr:hypothetical protein [Botryobacter ruber]
MVAAAEHFIPLLLPQFLAAAAVVAGAAKPVVHTKKLLATYSGYYAGSNILL